MLSIKSLLCCAVLIINSVVGQWEVDPNTPTMPNASHTCVMWGECVNINGFLRNCEYTGAAVQLFYGLAPEERDLLSNLLDNWCPYMLMDENGNRLPDDEVYTCCAPNQVYSFTDPLPLASGILGRCPACLRNFARQICEMNCSPEQSRFLDVRKETTPDGLVYIDEIDYRMHDEFMYGSHGACSGVVVPQTGLPAINIMCGAAAVCDAESWFGYSGDATDNPFVGTQVNFIPWPIGEESMNVRPVRCNETYENDLPCSCVDCLSTCPTGGEPVLTEVCTVFSIHCAGFAVGLTFFVLSVTVFCILTLLEYRNIRRGTAAKPLATKHTDNKLIQFFEAFFSNIGSFSSKNPLLIFLLTSWLVFAMLFGAVNINITANPIEIWSGPESRSRQDFNYFNSRFGPFYRAAQVFLTVDLEPLEVDGVIYGPAFRLEALQELIRLEDAIINLGRDTGGVVLEDVCYAPLRSRGAPPSLDQCVSMSASVYLGDDRNNINNATYLNKILGCLNNFYGLDCLASWGGGAEPEISFGGYEDGNILNATTLLINFPISNYLSVEELIPVLEWEQAYLDLILDYEQNTKPEFIDVAYAAERSIQDEIERVSRAEAVPIAASYVLMFIYVTLALGKFTTCKTFLVGSKVLVAVGSIIVVLIAIFCAIGLMGYTGISTTLLAVNVIPFFILSVGIDNVFLMVNTMNMIESDIKQYEGYNESFNFNKKREFLFRKMMEKVGPSIFVTSATQITCFGIGTLANFPAVTTFAIFAVFSLGFLFVLQITTVIAILSIDYKRSSKFRLDVLFCIQRKTLDDSNPLTSGAPYVGVIQRLMVPYSKIVQNWKVKITVAIIFIAMASASVMMIPQIEIGLEQELALPKDSYVYKYLQAVSGLFKLGIPVYFVLKPGLNFSDPIHQNVVCGGQMCNEDSLTTQIFLAALYPDITYMQRSSNSWIDDFFDWTGLTGSCCKYNIEDDSFCQSSNSSKACQYCSIERDQTGLRPAGDAFAKYIPFFLQDEPTDICNKGGLASYFSQVNYLLDEEGRATVYESSFMAYHKQLSSSYDYITAIKYAYEICDSVMAAIKRNTGLDVEVFAYSVFYPFFEQYLSMWPDTLASLGYSLLGVFVIVLLTSGFDVTSTFAVILTTVLVVVDMMGVMYIWSIPLNAVSCVNLLVSIGIAVEFCSHLTYAYARARCSSDARVAHALRAVGSTLVTGITFTNIPIVVLAFSYTELIEIFFFRMFFSVVCLGFLHGMIFLPVLLSYINEIKS